MERGSGHGKNPHPGQPEEMWTPVRLNDGSSHPYGFGWFLEPYQGHPNVGHSGATDGFSASLQRFPEANLTVIVLCNSDEFDIATSWPGRSQFGDERWQIGAGASTNIPQGCLGQFPTTIGAMSGNERGLILN